MNDTVAIVLIKTELGKAYQVAKEAADIPGVEWSMVVTGPYDVIAAVKVGDASALGSLIVEQVQRISGVKEPTTLVGTQAFRSQLKKGLERFP